MSEEKCTVVVELPVAKKAGSTGFNQGSSASTVAHATDEQLVAVGKKLNQILADFQPPEPQSKQGQMIADEVEIEMGFKMEVESGEAIKLIFASLKGDGTIKARVKWKRSN